LCGGTAHTHTTYSRRATETIGIVPQWKDTGHYGTGNRKNLTTATFTKEKTAGLFGLSYRLSGMERIKKTYQFCHTCRL
jgi:hypothetical protein